MTVPVLEAKVPIEVAGEADTGASTSQAIVTTIPDKTSPPTPLALGEPEQKSAVGATLTDQTNFLPKRQIITVFFGLAACLTCSFLEQSIVATALPQISSDLHGGRESSWVATAYLLTSLAFTPLYGRWSDIFGRKVVLLTSLVIFLVFSLACALSRTMIQLIVFRAFQGIGGGALITMVLIIISDIVSLKERGKYQAINELIIAVTNGIAPLLGGVFTQYTSWRWCFWINLPLGGSAIVICTLLLPLKRVEGDIKSKLLKIDYIGSCLTIVSSTLLLLGLNWGGVTYPWKSAAVLVPLVLGVVILFAFILWEAKFALLPIVPARIFKNKTVSGVYIATFMNGMVFFTILYYIPQYMQLVRGYSPVKASVLVIPFLAPVALFICVTSQTVARIGHYRPFIIGGYMTWSIAQGLQTTVNEHTSTAKIVGTLFMGGMSAGFIFQTTLLAAQAAVPRKDMAVVTGVRNFVRLFGSTIALAAGATLVNNTLRMAVRPLGLTPAQLAALVDDPTVINDPTRFTLGPEARHIVVHGYARGFHRVFFLTAGCTLVGLVVAVFMIEQHELNRPDDSALKAQAKLALQAKAGKHDVEAAGRSAPAEGSPAHQDTEVEKVVDDGADDAKEQV